MHKLQEARASTDMERSETWNCYMEVFLVSNDVRGGRQSNRRSRYHLQIRMEQRHFCEAGHIMSTHNENVLNVCTCSLPLSILSINWSPLWRSSSRSSSIWAILSCRTKDFNLLASSSSKRAFFILSLSSKNVTPNQKPPAFLNISIVYLQEFDLLGFIVLSLVVFLDLNLQIVTFFL